jgi:hypothetical protein
MDALARVRTTEVDFTANPAVVDLHAVTAMERTDTATSQLVRDIARNPS